MSFDFAVHLGKVQRSVKDLERDGKPVRAVTLARNYATSVDDLWDAVTNPERLQRWFLPITGDLEQGGRYQLQGNAGGTIQECDRPQFLSITWEFGGGMSWVELRLTRQGDNEARFSLTHICPVDDHWRQYGPGATGVGWDLGLLGLAAYFSGKVLTHEEAEATFSSPEGKAFIVDSSESWRQADVDSGEDPDTAAATAQRTAAFYTGGAC